jgi:endo-1,4-beta-D-glucanase Y
MTSTGGTSSAGGTGGVAGTNSAGGVTGAAGSTGRGGNSATGGTAGNTTIGGTTGTGGAGASTGSAGTGGQSSGTAGSGVGGQITTPPSATAKFPFPQNRRDTKCLYPTLADYHDVQKAYDKWKADLISTSGVGSSCTNCARVTRPADTNGSNGLQTNSTVSEGIGYGMIIAVYMNDQTLFDQLWRYEQAHTATASSGGFPATMTATSLMNWYIASDGTTATMTNGGQNGAGAATDADEDMAWALVMADKQWGGKGSLGDTYANFAKKLLGDVLKYEIDQTNNVVKNGSGWGGVNCLNISYFAPSHYRVFASYAGDSHWTSVVDKSYSIIAASLNTTNGNQNNGLVPAFSTSTGANDQCGTAGASNQKHTYQYDSCRTPFRIGIDACLNDQSSAASYVAKTTSFFAPKAVAGIVDGYNLDGSENPQFSKSPPATTVSYNGLSASFIGPAGVGAMYPQSGKDYKAFVDDVYAHLIDLQHPMWVGGQYYDESWTMLALLMMTGNYIDFTKY